MLRDGSYSIFSLQGKNDDGDSNAFIRPVWYHGRVRVLVRVRVRVYICIFCGGLERR